MARRFLKVLLAVLVLVAVFLVPRQIDRGFLTGQLEKVLTATLGFPVHIGRLELRGLNQLILRDVRMLDGENHHTIAYLKKLEIDYRFKELLRRHLRKVSLQSPDIDLNQAIVKKLRQRFKPQVAVAAAKENLPIPESEIKKSTQEFQLDEFELENAHFSFDNDGKAYVAKDFQLSFRDLNEKGVKDFHLFVDLGLEAASAGKLRYQASAIDFTKHSLQGADLEMKGFDLAILSSALQPWLPPPFQGGKATGKLDLQLSYPNLEHGVSVLWNVAKFGLESADGSMALADFDFKGKATNHIAADFQTFQVDFQNVISGGQLLAGVFYQDFKGESARVEGQAQYQRQKEHLELKQFKMSIPKLGTAKLSGSFRPKEKQPYQDLKVEMNFLDLQEFFRLGGRELLSNFEKSIFQDAQAKGKLKILLSWRAHVLNGKVEAEDFSFENENLGFAIEQASIDLPFFYQGGSESFISAPSPIFISWLSLRKGPLLFGEADFQLLLKRNRLSLEFPLVVNLFGGEIVIPWFEMRDVRNPLLGLESELLVSRLDLAELSREMQIQPMRGFIHGTFDKIQVKGGDLQTKGFLKADAFNGEVNLENLWGSDLGSGNRKIGFDASFREINLGLLSRMTNFGYINGVLEGSLKGFVLYGTLPLAFDLDLGTVKRPGVDLKVGIEAVRKIAIFAGASSALQFLDQGIYRFVDTYNYEALGARAVLSQGLLRLQAKLARGEQKLFLKGRSFPRIDVVYNEGGGAVLFETILHQIDSIKLKLRKENE